MTGLKLPNLQSLRRESNCPVHGDYGEEGATIGEHTKWFGCPKCREDIDKIKQINASKYRREQEKNSRRVALERRFRGVGVPLRFQARTFENYRGESSGANKALRFARVYAEQFKKMRENGASLILCGSPGTGKTHLAAAVANEIYADYLVLFRGVLAAVRHVKNTWNRNSEQSEADAIADLVKPDLLILDDVGVQFGSEAEKIILFEIINGRYEQMKPTIITANLTKAELNQYLGERVMDRLTEGGGAVIAFDWDSYRSKVAKDPALQSSETEAEVA